MYGDLPAASYQWDNKWIFERGISLVFGTVHDVRQRAKYVEYVSR
jgi:hypothetical protein